MMYRHFRLSSELTGAIAKILPHAKNQLSAPAVSSINSLLIYIYIYKRDSLACAVRLADTLCPNSLYIYIYIFNPNWTWNVEVKVKVN